jgi:hypothetical protein
VCLTGLFSINMLHIYDELLLTFLHVLFYAGIGQTKQPSSVTTQKIPWSIYELTASNNSILTQRNADIMKQQPLGLLVLISYRHGKRPFWRPRRRYECNINMYIQEGGWGMDWIDLAQDRDRWRPLVYAVRAVESVHKSSDSDIFKTSGPTSRFLKLRLLPFIKAQYVLITVSL